MLAPITLSFAMLVTLLKIKVNWSSKLNPPFSEPDLHGYIHDGDAQHGRPVQGQALRLRQPESLRCQRKGQEADFAYFPGKFETLD